MATQGLLSIVDKNGTVKMKAVCGCNGFNTKALQKKLEEIIKSGTLSLQKVYDAALDLEFGCSDCLVVLDNDKEIMPFMYENDETLPKIYRKTFGQPKFNPRWECGLADYVAIVEEKKQ